MYTQAAATRTHAHMCGCVCVETQQQLMGYTPAIRGYSIQLRMYVCKQARLSLCSLYAVHAVLTAKRNSSGRIARVSADRRRGRAPLRIVAKRIMPNLARAAFSYHHIIISS